MCGRLPKTALLVIQIPAILLSKTCQTAQDMMVNGKWWKPQTARLTVGAVLSNRGHASCSLCSDQLLTCPTLEACLTAFLFTLCAYRSFHIDDASVRSPDVYDLPAEECHACHLHVKLVPQGSSDVSFCLTETAGPPTSALFGQAQQQYQEQLRKAQETLLHRVDSAQVCFQATHPPDSVRISLWCPFCISFQKCVTCRTSLVL